MPTTLVSGYYGFGNLGDEAILASLVQQVGHLTDLVVLSEDPAATEYLYGVRAIQRMDLVAFLAELARADLFVSGGGGLMQDVTGGLSVSYYAGLLKLAQWRGVPTMIFGQGLGPLRHGFNRKLAGWAFSGSRAITLRDPDSVALATELGVPPAKIHLSADPVLALKPAPPERIAQILAELRLDPERPVVGVAIRPWHGWFERQFKALASALSELACAQDAQLLLLPFQMPGDERITEELHDCLSYRPTGNAASVAMLRAPLNPPEMLGLIGRCDVVVGMRLHALIMAASSAVPAVGLVYDPKVAELCRAWGFDAMPSIESLSDVRLLETKLTTLWSTRHARREDLLARRVPELAKAQANFEVLCGLLGLDGPSEPVRAASTGV